MKPNHAPPRGDAPPHAHAPQLHKLREVSLDAESRVLLDPTNHPHSRRLTGETGDRHPLNRGSQRHCPQVLENTLRTHRKHSALARGSDHRADASGR